MNCNDEEIIELIKRYDRRSEFQTVKCLEKCRPSVSAVLIRMDLHEEDERSSVFNHSLATFIINVRKGKFKLTGAAKICTYITETAKRIWLNRQRDINRPAPEQPQEENGPDPDLLARIKDALQQLAPSDQDILTAFYFYDQSLEDYAAQKKISHAAAKQRISRARTRLKELLN